MSSNNVKIKVKFGVNEVEIESPLDSIRDAVDAIPSIIRNLGSNVKIAENVTAELNEQANAVQTKVQVDVPEIKIEKGDSLSDMVVKMFKDSWGKQSKRLSDVRQALETYGLSYPKQSVAVTLMRLAQNGKLRRFKGSDGEFVYTAASTLFSDGQQVTSDLQINDDGVQ
jgi:predicted house-cleaning noncanonical NTP pyrophosphatase (MazG superfamily)